MFLRGGLSSWVGAFWGLGTRLRSSFLLLLISLQKCEVIFEYCFVCDCISEPFHIFFNKFHLTLNTVFILQQIFRLELLENFKYHFPLLFSWLLATGQFALFPTLDFHLEILMEIILQVITQLSKLFLIYELSSKLFIWSIFHHFESDLFEMIFDWSFDNLMFLSDFMHEVLKYLMRSGAWLWRIHHVE